MFSAKYHFNICWKIYSQIDFDLSRVKLQKKLPEGNCKHRFQLAGFRVIGVRVIGVRVIGVRVIGVRVIGVKITVNIWGKSKGN